LTAYVLDESRALSAAVIATRKKVGELDDFRIMKENISVDR